MRLQQVLEKYLPLIGNMLLPMIVFVIALYSFLIKGTLSLDSAKIFHWIFYGASFVSLILLLNFNRGKPLFIMIVIGITYMLINYLKNRFGADFNQTVWYQNLCVILPYNLLFFYLVPTQKFILRKSLMFLVTLITEYTVLEFLGRWKIFLEFNINGNSVICESGFAILICWVLIRAIKTGSVFDYTLLFVFSSVGLGVFFAADASGLSLFFGMSQSLLLFYILYTLVYNYYYDEATGFFSRNSYLIQSKHFPLKYSLGIISIDNYDKLLKTVGARHQYTLNNLIAKVVQDKASDALIYRYDQDQFVILYKKFDKKEAFQQLDDIRRTIAGAAFEYSATKKPLKLTVSCSVAEKKRSDTGAVEVLMRADKEMRKTLKFSHNVTSMG